MQPPSFLKAPSSSPVTTGAGSGRRLMGLSGGPSRTESFVEELAGFVAGSHGTFTSKRPNICSQMCPSLPDRPRVGNSVSALVMERVSSSLTQNDPYVSGASMLKSSFGSMQVTGIGMEASAGALSDGFLSEKDMYVPSSVSPPPIQSTSLPT